VFPVIVVTTKRIYGVQDRQQLIELYNGRRSEDQDSYAPGSLSSKRLSEIISDIASLSNQPVDRSGASGHSDGR
jgi:hypothetical protein